MINKQANTEPYKERKPFTLPSAHSDMRRVYAYLLKNHLLDRDIVTHFVREKLIYESCERVENKQGKWKEYHNAVFVGLDENGVARHAHKRGLYTKGGYKGNVDSSDPAYSFHYIGSGSRLHVFEAPIDMLSYLSLNPKDWQRQSYAALCGVAEHAMLKILDLYPHLSDISFCLDHDITGIEAAGRLSELLAEKGYSQVSSLWPQYKDWNEDIKAARGLVALTAKNHPQLAVCAPVCDRIAGIMNNVPKSADPEKQIPGLLDRFNNYLHWGKSQKAVECMENVAALVGADSAKHHRPIGQELRQGRLRDYRG